MVGERLIGEWSGVRDERQETKILLEGERGFGYFGRGEKRTDVDIFDFVQDKLTPVGTERHDSGFSRSDNP